MAPTVAMWPLANGSISNFACNISNYLCTNFVAFIKKCTIRPKMAAYPLYYYNTLSSEWIVITNARVLQNAIIKFYNNEMYTCLPLCLPANGLLSLTHVFFTIMKLTIMKCNHICIGQIVPYPIFTF